MDRTPFVVDPFIRLCPFEVPLWLQAHASRPCWLKTSSQREIRSIWEPWRSARLWQKLQISPTTLRQFWSKSSHSLVVRLLKRWLKTCSTKRVRPEKLPGLAAFVRPLWARHQPKVLPGPDCFPQACMPSNICLNSVRARKPTGAIFDFVPVKGKITRGFRFIPLPHFCSDPRALKNKYPPPATTSSRRSPRLLLVNQNPPPPTRTSPPPQQPLIPLSIRPAKQVPTYFSFAGGSSNSLPLLLCFPHYVSASAHAAEPQSQPIYMRVSSAICSSFC